MRREGFPIDEEFARSYEDQLRRRLAELERQVTDLAWREYRVGGLDLTGGKNDLIQRLFIAAMGLPLERGKSGRPLANRHQLAPWADRPIIAAYIEYARTRALLDSFVKNIIGMRNAKSGCIHTELLTCHVPTGRFASKAPNLQNIPKEEFAGAPIRRAFCARPGHYLVDLDYSQVEMRFYAMMGPVKVLMEGYRQGLDIHQYTAAQVFKLPFDAVSKEQRRRAKGVNFGAIYGQTPTGLANLMNLPVQEAEALHKRFWETMADGEAFIDRTIRAAQKDATTTTYWGRIRRMPEFLEVIAGKRVPDHVLAKAGRQAFNTVVQGSAADLMRRSLWRVHDAIRDELAGRVKMLLTVHDSLTLEVPDDIPPDEIERVIRPAMEYEAGGMHFPVEMETGKNWGEMKKWERSERKSTFAIVPAAPSPMAAAGANAPAGETVNGEAGDDVANLPETILNAIAQPAVIVRLDAYDAIDHSGLAESAAAHPGGWHLYLWKGDLVAAGVRIAAGEELYEIKDLLPKAVIYRVRNNAAAVWTGTLEL